MNNKLVCPFCKEEIISDFCLMCDKIDKGYTSGRQIYKCNKCSLFGNKELWHALTQAKQDLEIARQALKEIRDETGEDRAGFSYVVLAMNMKETAEKALEQITHDNSEKANSVEHKESFK